MVASSSPSVSGRPFRPEYQYRVRFFRATGAGIIAGLVLLVVYYATLGLLPAVFDFPATHTVFPLQSWAERFDFAQFWGTFVLPPTPTPLTWWVGLVIWWGLLAGGGVGYAILLSWTLQPSDVGKGIGFGVALFLGLAFLITLSQAYQPAIMRHALPDPGVLLIGWTLWATIQFLGVWVLYGAVLGWLYRRWTPPETTVP